MTNEKAITLAIGTFEKLIQNLYQVDKRVGIAVVFDEPTQNKGVIMGSNLTNEAVKHMLINLLAGIDETEGIEDILKKAKEDYGRKDKD